MTSYIEEGGTVTIVNNAMTRRINKYDFKLGSEAYTPPYIISSNK